MSAALLLGTPPQIIRAHVIVEADRIIIDRSEFPLSQYPAITNTQLLRQVADMAEQDTEAGRVGWLERQP